MCVCVCVWVCVGGCVVKYCTMLCTTTICSTSAINKNIQIAITIRAIYNVPRTCTVHMHLETMVKGIKYEIEN